MTLCLQGRVVVLSSDTTIQKKKTGRGPAYRTTTTATKIDFRNAVADTVCKKFQCGCGWFSV